MSMRHIDYLWIGTSVNLLSFALTACLVGNLAYGYMALGSIVTVRAGLPVSTLARAAFGMRGNLPNALLSWISSVAFEVINTVFGVEALLALFKLLGWNDSGSVGKLVAVLLQLLLCGGVAVLGHATMVWFQRMCAALISVALLVVFAFTIGKVDWSHAGTTHAQLGSSTVLA